MADITVEITNIGATQLHESSRSGIPKIVATVLGTKTAVAATVSQTINFVNLLEVSVCIIVIL